MWPTFGDPLHKPPNLDIARLALKPLSKSRRGETANVNRSWHEPLKQAIAELEPAETTLSMGHAALAQLLDQREVKQWGDDILSVDFVKGGVAIGGTVLSIGIGLVTGALAAALATAVFCGVAYTVTKRGFRIAMEGLRHVVQATAKMLIELREHLGDLRATLVLAHHPSMDQLQVVYEARRAHRLIRFRYRALDKEFKVSEYLARRLIVRA